MPYTFPAGQINYPKKYVCVIGALVANLKSNNLYEDSIIIFVSDNGGSMYNGGVGSNLPLRGGKFTVYEGGIRTPAFIHGPKFIPKSG